VWLFFHLAMVLALREVQWITNWTKRMVLEGMTHPSHCVWMPRELEKREILKREICTSVKNTF
jgi:hypothetical protein